MLVGAALVGCGAAPPSVDTWVANAEDLCSEFQREASRFPAPSSGPGLAISTERLADLAGEEAAALRDLPRPEQSEEQVLAWLDAVQRRANALVVYAARLTTTPQGQAVAIPSELAEATGEGERLAAELSLVSCGAGVDLSAGPPASFAPDAPGASGTAPVITGIDGTPTDETTTQDQ
jgi:hypothetical protein